LSYKENTNSIKNSPSIATLQKLKNKKFKIFDPIVKKVPLKNVIYCNTIKETILGTDVLIIATAWDLFKKDVTVKILNKHFYGKVIIDPFNVLNKNILNKKKFQIYSLK
jgi:UDPglucose 6-dehydrogenase